MEYFIVGLSWAAILGAVVYLVVRRYRMKKKENFEKRDN